VLKSIFGQKRVEVTRVWKKVNEGLHNLKSRPNIVTDPIMDVEINGECSKLGNVYKCTENISRKS
jgi:hypothetical protein